MSVFSKHFKESRKVSDIKPIITVHNNYTTNMEDEKINCRNGHTWGGEIPTVNPEILNYQNVNLVGKPCDCGMVVYDEGKCGCQIPKWQIELKENN